MTNPDDYRILSKVCVEGPSFLAIAATAFDANTFLERIRALAAEAQQTKNDTPDDSLEVQPNPQRSA